MMGQCAVFGLAIGLALGVMIGMRIAGADVKRVLNSWHRSNKSWEAFCWDQLRTYEARLKEMEQMLQRKPKPKPRDEADWWKGDQ